MFLKILKNHKRPLACDTMGENTGDRGVSAPQSACFIDYFWRMLWMILSAFLVDDEADIRRIIRILLESRGYRVLEAPNGRLAVETIRKSRTSI